MKSLRGTRRLRSFRSGLMNSGDRSFHSKGGNFFRKFPKRLSGLLLPSPLENHLRQKQRTLRPCARNCSSWANICFSRRPSLDRHLAEDCVHGLKRRPPSATAVVDGIDHTQLSRGKLLGAAAFSRYLRKEFPDERIAIVLPASKGSMVANLAVMLANKVPVDLNFTIGRAANESCCRRANLRVAISATPFIERVKDFPWPEHVLKLDELLPRMKRQIVLWWILSTILPARLLLRLLNINSEEASTPKQCCFLQAEPLANLKER